VCVLHSLERDCVCTAQSREGLCVCTAQSREGLCVCVRVCVCTAQSRKELYVCTALSREAHYANGHERTITVILAKHCIKLPDDGSLVIRNMLEQFKYF